MASVGVITGLTGDIVRAVAASSASRDAWFLETVACADKPGGADLTAVIEAGDAINHDIFDPQEIEGAANRLAEAGLLSIEDNRFRMTDEGRLLLRGSPSKQPLTRIEWLGKKLRELPASCGEVEWRIDAQAYAHAISDYQRRANKVLAEIREHRHMNK